MRATDTRRLAAATIAVAAFALVWNCYLDAQRRGSSPARPRTGVQDAPHPLDELTPVASAPPNVADERSELPQPSLPSSASTPAPHRMWQFVDGPAPVLPGTENGLIELAQRVQLERAAIAAVAVGDRIEIALPNGHSFAALVAGTVVHDNGDRSWSGHLDGYGLRYPVIYTQGDVATFGTITSPDGLFTLEVIEDQGVLYRDRREDLHDPRNDCAVLPD